MTIAAGALGQQETSMLLAGRSILVIEDEPMVAALLDDMLTGLGCENVARATTIERAIESVTHSPPDAALLDISVKGAASFPVATLLAEKEIPFVFATGYGASALQPPWIGHDCLVKPFSIDALESALRKVFREQQTRVCSDANWSSTLTACHPARR
jgi:CheY-like chemotaxis protein